MNTWVAHDYETGGLKRLIIGIQFFSLEEDLFFRYICFINGDFATSIKSRKRDDEQAKISFEYYICNHWQIEPK